jgi:hypothetical protein
MNARAKGLVGVALAALILLAALDSGRLALPIAASLITGLAIVGLGSVLFALFRNTTPDLATLFVVSYPLYGTLCFAVGLFSTGPVAIGAVLALPALAGAWHLRHQLKPDTLGFDVSATDLILLLAAGVTAVLFAQFPPFTLDELAYHLAAPHAWVTSGKVAALPLNSHSWFPFGIEGADLPLLALFGRAGGIASHFLHLLAAIATSWIVIRSVAGEGRRGGAAAVAFLTAPALLVTAGWSWVEWPLVGIAAVLFITLSRIETGHSDSSVLLAMTIAAGLTTKYTFIPYLAVCLISFLITVRTARSLAPAVAAGIAAGSFFFIRNLILTGNPLYPFFDELAPAVSGFRASSSALTTFSNYMFDRRFVDEALGLGPFAVAALAIAFGGRLESRFGRLCVPFSVAAALAIALSAPSSRILLPFLLPAVLVFGNVAASRSAEIRRILTLSLRLIAVAQLVIVSVYLASFDPPAVLGGRTDQDEFLSSHRRHYPELKWLNGMLPPSARPLVIGAQELYWIDAAAIGGGNFDAVRIDRFLATHSADDLLRRRVTHLVVVSSGIRVGTPSEDPKIRERETVILPDTARKLQILLTERSVEIGRYRSTAVFELR